MTIYHTAGERASVRYRRIVIQQVRVHIDGVEDQPRVKVASRRNHVLLSSLRLELLEQHSYHINKSYVDN